MSSKKDRPCNSVTNIVKHVELMAEEDRTPKRFSWSSDTNRAPGSGDELMIYTKKRTPENHATEEPETGN